ncbi:MAG: Ig-like domain-containing protein [Tannerella sp.]|jgi:hypothetical protein|nr:Ig-like domain-containing protein [Tannerella sp.]
MKRLKKTGLSFLFALFCWAGYAQTVSEVEWWFDGRYDEAQRASIGGSDITWRSDISTDALSEGLHVLHLRLKDNSGRYSSISSDYFFKLSRSTSTGNMVEYWFDDGFDSRKQESIPANGTVSFEWPTSELSQGLHILHYRTGYAPGAMRSVHSDYFFKLNSGNAQGAKRLVYWFDDKMSESVYQTLDSHQTLASLEIDASRLSPGGHVLHMRLGYENGGYASTTTDYFVHGTNPFGIGSASTPLALTEYAYWFDQDADNSVSVRFEPPVSTVDLVEEISAASLTVNETHTFNISFKRNDGQSVLLSEPFNASSRLIINAPRLGLSPSKLQRGENLEITGENFTPNGQVSFSCLSNNLSIDISPVFADATGIITYRITVPNDCAEGLYNLSATDQSSGKTVTDVPLLISRSGTPPTDSRIHISYPNNPNIVCKTGNELIVLWDDFIALDTRYQIFQEDALRKYSYFVELELIDSQSENGVVEDQELEGKASLEKTKNFQCSFHPQKEGTYIVRIWDKITNQYVESAPFSVETHSGRLNMVKKWDYSADERLITWPLREKEPKGVAADGTSRIYLSVSPKAGTSLIEEITLTLKDEKTGYDNTRLLGKVMPAAAVTNEYSDEANVANVISTTVSFPGTEKGSNVVFWYVAPDDFTGSDDDKNESTRLVKAVFDVTFTDHTTAQEYCYIEIVRPALMMVHGLGSSHECWNNFSLHDGIKVVAKDTRFITAEAIDVRPNSDFATNAGGLLNVNPKTPQSTFEAMNIQMMYKGYASNQVDYVCHSMGGCILRLAEEYYPGLFYSRRNYGKGFVHKVVTIDTPHNGSPWADMTERLTNWLYNDVSRGGFFGTVEELIDIRKSLAGILLENTLFKKDAFFEAIETPPDDVFNTENCIFKPTDAVLDLRESSGGVRFHETPLRSHLIVGDIFPGYPHNGLSLNAIDEMLEADAYYAAEIEKFEIFLDVVTLIKYLLADPDGKLEILIDEVDMLLKSRNLKNRNLRVMELCYKILSVICTLGEETENFILDSDGIVSYSSQSAGLNGSIASNVSAFEGMGSNHLTVVEKEDVGRKVEQLLNASIHSPMFNSIPASPSAGPQPRSFQLRSAPEPTEVSISEDENRLQILNVEQGTNLTVGDNLQVSVRIIGLEHLTRLQLTFHGKNYYAPEFAEYVTFNIPVTGFNLQTQSLYVKAYYDDGSSAWMVYATKELNVIPKENAIELYTDEQVYYLFENETVRPQYTIVFPDFIFTGLRNTNIQATVTDENVVGFDAETCSFTGKKAGATAVELVYEDVSKTVWFVVEAPVYRVESVDLDQTQLELHPEETEQLTALIIPTNATNQNVTWSSDNETIATVNNGLVTGVAIGTAIITVTTEDGEQTATCTVTVVPIDDDDDGDDDDDDDDDGDDGDDGDNGNGDNGNGNNGNGNNGNGDNGNGDNGNGDNGNGDNGNGDNGNGDNGNSDGGTGTEHQDVTPKLYPNPAKGMCYLYLPGTLLNGPAEYVIVSVVGQTVQRQAITNKTTAIDISGLARGVYFVIAVRENQVIFRQKLLIE